MQVALTIDVEDPDHDGHSHPAGIESMLGAMEAEGMRATFFLQGRWSDANPDVAKAIVAGGHAVGNHSYYHVDVRLLTAAGFREDTLKAHRTLEDVVGVDARPWYRLPYGAGAGSRWVRRQLGSLGYQHVGWDVDVRDYALTDGRALLDTMSADLSRLDDEGADHAIVLLHSWPTVTLRSMPAVCRFLAKRYDAIVTIDRLAGHGAVATRRGKADGARRLASRARGGLRGLVAR